MQAEWLHKIEELITRYAESKAKRVYLEQFRKSKKAILMRQAESKGCRTGVSQETYAYAHPEYIELLRGLQEATEQEEKDRWNLKQREWKFDQWRTTEATNRQTMSRYGAA